MIKQQQLLAVLAIVPDGDYDVEIFTKGKESQQIQMVRFDHDRKMIDLHFGDDLNSESIRRDLSWQDRGPDTPIGKFTSEQMMLFANWCKEHYPSEDISTQALNIFVERWNSRDPRPSRKRSQPEDLPL